MDPASVSDAPRDGSTSPLEAPGAMAHGDGAVTEAFRKSDTGTNRGRQEAEWPRVRGYEVLSLIGSGGMGVVYKARQCELRRIVALKTIRASALTDPIYLERFYAEAEAVARLQHPNIIQVFEVGTVEPRLEGASRTPFIALEYMDGGNLLRHARHPQEPHDAARMVEKLARATHAAHQLGVIHRDLKPANVLLTRDGEPKIADFGVAKRLWDEEDVYRCQTQAGTVMGTPEYMAPEQISSAATTMAVDVYALGVILYQLLTARVPFQAATPLETIELVRTQDPVSPRELQPRLPRDLDTICLKCLDKDPARRYPSAEALADDLKRFHESRPIRARRVSHLEKFARWCKRDPLAAGLLGAVLACFLVAFVLVSLSYWRSESARAELAEQRDEAQRREKAERWERYRANIVAAANALRVYNATGARSALDDAPKEHRNWEWQLFHSRLDMAKHVLAGPSTGTVSERAFSADSQRVALASDKAIRVWDTASARELMALTSAAAIANVRLSPDGRTLAYRLLDRQVLLRDVDANQVRAVLTGHERTVQAVEFTADGKRLLTGSQDQPYRVWDVETGKLVQEIPMQYPIQHNISFNADGSRMTRSAPGADVVEIWDVAKERRIATVPDDRHNLQRVHLDQTGDLVKTVESYPSNCVRLWDAATGRLISTLCGHTNSVSHCEFSPDCQLIATGSRDQTIGLWNAATGQSLATFRGHRGAVRWVSFSADGKRLVSAAEDHTVRLWDVQTGESLAVLVGHAGDVCRATFTSDGRTIVSVSEDGTARCWDTPMVENTGILRGHKTFVYGVAFHPDGEHVASASWDGTVRIWHATSGRQTAQLPHGDSTFVSSVAFHPSGTMLASRTRGGVYLWDVASGKLIYRWDVPGGDWRDTRVAFNPRGDRLAAGCRGREIRIWDVDSHGEVAVLRGHEEEVRDVAFSPDGRWLASAGNNKVRIWDARQGTQVRVLSGHTGEAYAVAFNTDGTLLASGATDGTARIWDSATWSEIATLKHGINVYGVAFSRDNTRLACAGADNSIRLWDVKSYQEVADLRGHSAYVHQVAFSPDGTRMVSASGDHTLRIWDTLSAQDRAARTRACALP